MFNYKIIILFSLFFLANSCFHSHDHEDGHSHGQGHSHDDASSHEEEHGGDEVHLNDTQIKTIGLKTGTFQSIKTGNFIKTNGVLDLPPDEYATLTAPAEGFVKTTKGEYLVGSFVRKGTLLATLEHPNYIQLQQNYLELLAQLTFQEQELARQQTLNNSEAGVLKKLQEAESQHKVLLARRDGLKQQLQYLGISPDQVEQGTISSVINLLAPISGYITTVNIHKGKFVQPTESLYEIVNNDHVHLELDVFENDIAKVKEGQRISFTIPSLGSEAFEGEVKLVGKSFNMENKTVRVHGHIKGKHPEFIRGFYLEAKIWIDAQTVLALPSEAIVLESGVNYIFVKAGEENGETVFKKIAVKTGYTDGDFVEVKPIDPMPNEEEIVIKETFFLYASLNKGEHDHAH